ncbi:putative Zn-dependent metalloprotease, SprT family [Haloarcula tailed virus 2]|uniref:Zn-dependent metalloprotease, SprT family n=1 Tax=Haloarcula tailed virus 2 TaxID=2877989 RepID=A0AAE9BYL1_9CAUD|nr:putative Zn-dependent metalloprotease, SprT family [Haloarcula tailed virus 2]UBF23243.1 putative Zn-dependent metalloprotease, SprT family [Haloarcula tailed virus 2]
MTYKHDTPEQVDRLHADALSKLSAHYSRCEKVYDHEVEGMAERVYAEMCEEHPYLHIASNQVEIKFEVWDILKTFSLTKMRTTRAGGSCLTTEDMHGHLSIVNLSVDAYEGYGYEMYERVIRHELIHAEIDHSFASPQRFTDGDEEFERMCKHVDATESFKKSVQYAHDRGIDQYLSFVADINDMEVSLLLERADVPYIKMEYYEFGDR